MAVLGPLPVVWRPAPVDDDVPVSNPKVELSRFSDVAGGACGRGGWCVGLGYNNPAKHEHKHGRQVCRRASISRYQDLAQSATAPAREVSNSARASSLAAAGRSGQAMNSEPVVAFLLRLRNRIVPHVM